MVKIRSFDGLVFKPELYDQLLSRNMEYLDGCQFLKDFNTQDLMQKGVLHA